MNTILHLTAVLASLWASIFAFQTLNEPALGGALFILFFGYIAMTIAALDDDLTLAGKGFLKFRTNPIRDGISNASKIALIITVVLLFMATFNKVGGDAKDVAVVGPTTAFGEVSIAELTPLVQLQYPYTVNPRLSTALTAGSGTATVTDSLLVVSTGTTTASDVLCRSVPNVKYHPGQGTLARWTALFENTPVAGTESVAGLGNEEDGLFFGYNGADFGILHRFGGAVEHQTLSITNGADISGGTITITLDGVATEVEVALNDSPQAVARAIDAVSFVEWEAQAIGADVVFISHHAEVEAGAFTFADTDTTGVAASFTETISGVAPTNTWINQADWNIDTMDGDSDKANPSGMLLDHDRGNVYEVQFQWLGFGALTFAVEDEATGRISDVHQIQYTNNNIQPSMQNPTLPLYASVKNNATTTDVIIKLSSQAAFTEGGNNKRLGLVNSAAGSVSATDATTEIALLSIINKPVFEGSSNRVDTVPLIVNFSSDGSGAVKSTTFRIRVNPIIGGDPVFTDISTTTSVMAFDTAGTTLTGGGVVSTLQFANQIQGFQLDIAEFSALLPPGTIISFSVETDGGTVDAGVAMTWRELF